ncbi:MAG: mannose-6-phosphate isomerase, class I [Deltaproteobacteria bacterium]|nr:mannose-6-phosphate isomerase, class I [Deltaproteobacteria bacterium]
MSTELPAKRPVLLEPHLKSYSWGSRTSLPRLLGLPVPSDVPFAELWFGAHPSGPAFVAGTPLPEWIARDRNAALGPGSAELRFLVKLLAAELPLSLQVHPDAALARARFDDPELRAASLAADPQPKPELIIALERFEALAGLRPFDDARDLCARIDVDCGRATDERSFLVRVLSGAQGQVGRAFQAMDRWPNEPCFSRAKDLHALYPADPAALSPLLLRHHVMSPGEALVIDPGVPHAYLHGTGLEVMESSDNVIRGGLTSKAVDVGAFAEAVIAGPCMPVGPIELAPNVRCYRGPASARFVVEDRDLVEVPTSWSVQGFEVVVVVRGTARIESTEGFVELSSGRSAAIPAACGTITARGDARVFRIHE